MPTAPRYRQPDLSWLAREGSPLPPGFLWGVANAAFQVEGGYNGPGQPENNWAAWERSGKVEPAGAAVGFWDDFRRHLDLAVGMGLNAFRLSVDWTRLQPQRGGGLDPDALARYVDMVVACRARGLEPIVTLFHFTHPAWLGRDPWLDGSGPPAFEAFVSAVIPGLCRAMDERGSAPPRWWITVNEPNIFAFATYAFAAMPSGARPSPSRFRRALDQLLTAHVLAYRGVHRAYQDAGWPGPNVTYNTYCMTAYSLDRALMDLGQARAIGHRGGRARSFLDDRRQAFDADLRGLRGPAAAGSDRLLERLLLPAPLDGLPSYVDALASGDGPGHDYTALDYYVGPLAHYLGVPFTGPWRRRRVPFVRELWETNIRPEGLRMFVMANSHPAMPVMVVENGMATWARGSARRDRPDGWTRPAYIRAHVAELLEAARRGANVAGYLHWTLVDNYEWGSYAPRFGLHGVDRSGEEPRILETDASGRDAAGTYREIVEVLRSGDGGAAARALLSPRP